MLAAGLGAVVALAIWEDAGGRLRLCLAASMKRFRSGIISSSVI